MTNQKQVWCTMAQSVCPAPHTYNSLCHNRKRKKNGVWNFRMSWGSGRKTNYQCKNHPKKIGRYKYSTDDVFPKVNPQKTQITQHPYVLPVSNRLPRWTWLVAKNMQKIAKIRWVLQPRFIGKTTKSLKNTILTPSFRHIAPKAFFCPVGFVSADSPGPGTPGWKKIGGCWSSPPRVMLSKWWNNKQENLANSNWTYKQHSYNSPVPWSKWSLPTFVPPPNKATNKTAF